MEMERERKPLPVVVDTMPGRALRTTYIDRKIYEDATGFHGVLPYSLVGRRMELDLPY